MAIYKNQTLKEILETDPNALDLTLRDLYRAAKEENDAGLSDSMTLSQFYEAAYKPEVSIPKRVSDDTIRQRETALRYWVQITGDPPLCEISKSVMNCFSAELFKRVEAGKMRPATIRKHCNALMSILAHAGPKTEKHREARELIPMPPAFPPVRVYLNPTGKTPSRNEVQAVIQACSCARWPKLPNITPGKWWECAYRILALTGMRKSDLFALRWSQIRNIGGRPMFVIPAEEEKTGVEKLIPISGPVRDVLDEMPRDPKNDRIFRWPHGKSLFQTERERIIFRAGIRQKVLGTFHAFRRFVATVVQDAQLVLGHTSAAVTARHYQSMTRAALALENLALEVRLE